MHIAVCDDGAEELSRIASLLEEYRRERDGSVTYETFHSAVDLLETMGVRTFDLLLLDILMPGVTGMDAAHEIRRTDQHIPIVFLTSSREFAVESYRVNAADYIIKPAQSEEIFSLLDRQLVKLRQEEAYLTLKTRVGLVKLPFSKIVCAEVMNRVVQFVLVGGEVQEVYGNLADYESHLLSSPIFYKPHRSYVVNLRQTIGLSKNGFGTTTGKVVPVARDAFAQTKAAYMKYLLDGKENA